MGLEGASEANFGAGKLMNLMPSSASRNAPSIHACHIQNVSNESADSEGSYTHFFRVGQTSGGTSLLLSDLNLLKMMAHTKGI